MKRAGNSGLQAEVEGAGLEGTDGSQPVAITSWAGDCAGLVSGGLSENWGGRIMEASGFLLALGGGPVLFRRAP